MVRAALATSMGFLALIATAQSAEGAVTFGAYASHATEGRSVVFTTESGQRLRLTPYGDRIVRVQAASRGEAFTPDDRWEMIADHGAWTGAFTVKDQGASFLVTTPGASARVDKNPLRITFLDANGAPRLAESAGAATGDRPLELRVNGQAIAAPARIAFPPTGGWSQWAPSPSTNVTLNVGANKIRVVSVGTNGPNVDRLEVDGTIYEAETAARSGASAKTSHAGYSGSGYVDFDDDTGAYVEWTVNVTSAGPHSIRFRYANADALSQSFAPAAGEHFVGLGHGAFGRVASLDLAGTVVTRERVNQAPLVVPFYMSSRGYGVFVHTTHATKHSFLAGDHHFEQPAGQIDWFYFDGAPRDVLDGYTRLTGRPRMPPLAAFGLAVSDKTGLFTLPGSDPWWRENIERMRTEGYPFDQVIHDNCWRGAKIGPWRWDSDRFPDPKSFQTFSRAQRVTNMLDFNRGGAPDAEGWSPTYALPGTNSFPDFTSATVRSWFWNVLWTKSLDPSLAYPGDTLWLDEFDEDVSPKGALANGRTWEEMQSYYFFLLAKSVGEGWDAGFGDTKRLFVMTRGMHAGGQRWSTVWSGDIQNTYDEMKLQIRGMLAAGLSGFPYWAHDAGGFKEFPTDAMYRQWGVAMGSFSPIWKPHGMGLRFPWLFGKAAQDDVKRYAALRMRLLPYLYSVAHDAHATGAPITRALLVEYPEVDSAWTVDDEYLFGRDILVVPDPSDGGGAVPVWLPPGDWYAFESDERMKGPQTLSRPSTIGALPLFVRAGAIIPGAHAMSATADWDKSKLLVDVYTGADGSFELVEDDGTTERFAKGELERTTLRFTDAKLELSLATKGTYPTAPTTRAYSIRFHGLAGEAPMLVDGKPTNASWDSTSKVLAVDVPARPAGAPLVVARATTSDGNTSGGPATPADPVNDDGAASHAGDDDGGASGCACREGRPRSPAPAPAPFGSAVLFLLSVAALVARRAAN